MDVLNYIFIRLGLTRAKALQTASRFPRETRRRFAGPKSNASALKDLTVRGRNPFRSIFPLPRAADFGNIENRLGDSAGRRSITY